MQADAMEAGLVVDAYSYSWTNVQIYKFTNDVIRVVADLTAYCTCSGFSFGGSTTPASAAPAPDPAEACSYFLQIKGVWVCIFFIGIP